MSILDEWVEKAEADYKAAVALSRPRREPLSDIVCYHCQQSAEKYLKAHLLSQGDVPLPIHNLQELLQVGAAHGTSLTALDPLAQFLNPFGVHPLSGPCGHRC